MLCYAKAVDDRSLIGSRIHTGSLDQLIFIDVAGLCNTFRCIILYDFLERFISLCTLSDEFLINQAFLDHDMHHTICKHDICSRFQFKMNICIFCKADISRIYNDQLCAISDSFTNLHTNNRMCFLWIRTNQKNTVYIMGDIIDRVCHRTGAQGNSKTGNRCRVTNTGTVICIIVAEAASDHLLNHVNILVRRTGTCKTSQRAGAILFFDLHEFRSHQIQSFIPGSSFKFAGFFILDQWILDSILGMYKIKACRTAFDTKFAMI